MLASPCVRLASRRAHLGSRAEGGGEPRSAPWLSYGAGVCLALAVRMRHDGTIIDLLAGVCSQPVARGLFEILILEQRPSAEDFEVAREWLDWYKHLVVGPAGADPWKTADSMKKTLGRKASGYFKVTVLPPPDLVRFERKKTVPGMLPVPTTAAGYVTAGSASRRPTHGPCPVLDNTVREWGLAGERGFIVPERAKGRVRKERDGTADEGFVQGLVHRDVLPTHVASHSDRYFSLEHMRHLSVGEFLHAAGDYCPTSALDRALVQNKKSLTAVQAASAIGRGEHLVSTGYALGFCLGDNPGADLLQGTAGGRKLRFASAFTGIGMSAAALVQEYGGALGGPALEWEYVFACEKNKKMTPPLLDAWGPYGLLEKNIFPEAAALYITARHLGRVDLLVLTPDCRNFSQRKHGRDRWEQADDLARFRGSLRYVREMRPESVLIENVADHECVMPMSAIIGALKMYVWFQVILCPWDCFRIPTKRKRSYWCGYLKH